MEEEVLLETVVEVPIFVAGLVEKSNRSKVEVELELLLLVLWAVSGLRVSWIRG